MEQPELEQLVRREVRRAMAAAGRRYLPVLAAVLTLVILVVLVPDASTSVNGVGSTSSLGTVSGVPDGSGQPAATSGGAVQPGASGGAPSSVPPSAGPGRTASVAGAQPGVARSPSAATPYTPGVAVNGTACGPGVRQFAFSPYAPMCVPRFAGNNGGATAHGVTGSTITFVMRNTTDLDATMQAVGASSFAATLADTQVLVDYFNKQFELYGRHVVIKTFDGQGSYVAEVGGQDQAGATSDAQSAYDAGGFLDPGLPAPTPLTYAHAESGRHVVSIGLPDTLAAARTYYPYEYQILAPVLDVEATGAANLLCQRMANLKAVYAGDATYQGKPRTFAAIMPSEEGSSGGTHLLFAKVKQQCGIDIEKAEYTVNPATYAQQSTQIAAKLKADHITTVVMFTDVVFAPVMTTAAAQEGYNPEWLDVTAASNESARRMSAQEVAHMMFVYPWAPQSEALSADPCYQIYRRANPTGTPQGNAMNLDQICASLLSAYGALQAAGPDLTPQTFGSGWFHQPASNGAGNFGAWSFGANQFSPDSTFTLQWWRADAKNDYDQGTGAYLACTEQANIPYLATSMGSGQLRCF